MEWLDSVFVDHSGLQAVVVISIIIAAGLGFGKIKLRECLTMPRVSAWFCLFMSLD